MGLLLLHFAVKVVVYDFYDGDYHPAILWFHRTRFHVLRDDGRFFSPKECGIAILKSMFEFGSKPLSLYVAMKIFCQIEFVFCLHFVPL